MIEAVAREAFPLCADPARDRAVRPVLQQAVEFLLGRVGELRLQAVILTGSLARGEGSVLLGPGAARLLGDIEMLVILRMPFDWAAARREMTELGREATRIVGADGRLACVEYAPAGIDYLRRNIRPCIFAHDLREHGKVVWGEGGILHEIRPFGVDEIPPENALELLMNRIVELLTPAASEGVCHDPIGRAYQCVKTVLDLAGSALASTGRYASSYGERGRRFAALLEETPDLVDALPEPGGFQAALCEASLCKLAPTPERLVGGAAAPPLSTVLGWATGLWVWEARRMLGLPRGSFPDLVEAYLRRESAAKRVKGWIKFWRHPLRPRGLVELRRAGRLMLRASPQRLTYAAALLAGGAVAEGRPEWRERATSLLPVAVGTDNGTALHGAVETWRWLIRNN